MAMQRFINCAMRLTFRYVGVKRSVFLSFLHIHVEFEIQSLTLKHGESNKNKLFLTSTSEEHCLILNQELLEVKYELRSVTLCTLGSLESGLTVL